MGKDRAAMGFRGRRERKPADVRATRGRTSPFERVAKKYLDPKRLIVVDAGDTSKTK